MKVYKLFLKLLFIVSLFVFYDVCALESEELRVSYLSNKILSGNINLSLTNEDNLFEINYDFYKSYMSIFVALKSDHEIKLKTVDLMGSVVDIDRFADEEEEGIDMYNRDGKWTRIGGIYFDSYKLEWRELIRKANGRDLKFNVECIEPMSGLSRKYTFKVSVANFRRFLEIFEPLP
ncbi:hypothetical protein [Borrelia hermsii]|uniref:Uncharacterized protein n=2 Tax=Borrelia hermsii TaxID=140 RepID=T1ECC6_BORHE|nr:hypothetical protein [Borrelia hermsii]ADN26363.1 hypothetical protein BHA107 [Borrelia hermsii]AMR75947.1 hypothetical protein A0V01_04870 [Borrelia hermsii]ANA43752.1 hypothetical protein AXX13_A0555 [Borrelia hermsii HS1]UPA08545.1 hypothetical protein bhDAH_001256 [Borrelia hermsii DAH]